MKLKTLKHFIKDIPDEAEVVLNNNMITFLYNGNTIVLNSYGSIWDSGIGYKNDGTICGECSHFECSKCRRESNDV